MSLENAADEKLPWIAKCGTSHKQQKPHATRIVHVYFNSYYYIDVVGQRRRRERGRRLLYQFTCIM
jgi:hypothetical protein